MGMVVSCYIKRWSSVKRIWSGLSCEIHEKHFSSQNSSADNQSDRLELHVITKYFVKIIVKALLKNFENIFRHFFLQLCCTFKNSGQINDGKTKLNQPINDLDQLKYLVKNKDKTSSKLKQPFISCNGNRNNLIIISCISLKSP